MSQTTRFQKKRPFRLRKYRVHTVLLLFVAAGILAAFWPAYVWGIQLNQEMNELQKEKKVLAKQTEALREEVRRLKTPEYVEQLARKDLGLVKPGEVPITKGTPQKP